MYRQHAYFPFGEEWVDQASETWRTPYTFTGKELDEETGLYYFGARYYDPRTSVWQSTDPAFLTAREPPLSVYAYSAQHPVNLSDPDGRNPRVALAAAGIGAVAGVGIYGIKSYLYDEELTAEGAGGSAAIGAGFGVAFYALGRISPALATALVRGAVIAKSSEAALKAAVLIREGTADPKLVADVALDGALAALGVSAAVKGTGTPAPAPASASPGPPGAASVGGVAAEAAAEAPNITFGHGARHLVGTGLGREEVESAIGAEVRSVAAKAGLGGSFWGRVPVGGKTIEFRAFPLPGGRVNVGTYYPLE